MHNRWLRLVEVEFLRYLLVGGVAFAGDIGTLALLHNKLGMYYLLATLIAFMVGTLINYYLSVRWVFHYRSTHQHSLEFGIFLLVGVLTLAMSLGMMALLVGRADLSVLLAKCVTTGFTLIANFGLRRMLLFSRWPQHMAKAIAGKKR
ncbi:GtrA family protein [Candidatus Igneacidithiobacillus taiwanensis]|uniref:GtrA family protein n=1 Tax=Candidatus Igneacidithiobacillus taiwanensis TaxID=1945924 RepID=UPI00289C2023|nr:GtrA family protein [Candidatus Igneacidithiobacillus taiwanensis]